MDKPIYTPKLLSDWKVELKQPNELIVADNSTLTDRKYIHKVMKEWYNLIMGGEHDKIKPITKFDIQFVDKKGKVIETLKNVSLDDAFVPYYSEYELVSDKNSVTDK